MSRLTAPSSWRRGASGLLLDRGEAMVLTDRGRLLADAVVRELLA